MVDCFERSPEEHLRSHHSHPFRSRARLPSQRTIKMLFLLKSIGLLEAIAIHEFGLGRVLRGQCNETTRWILSSLQTHGRQKARKISSCPRPAAELTDPDPFPTIRSQVYPTKQPEQRNPSAHSMHFNKTSFHPQSASIMCPLTSTPKRLRQRRVSNHIK